MERIGFIESGFADKEPYIYMEGELLKLFAGIDIIKKAEGNK